MHISFRLEVQRDKQNCVDTVNKNWLPWQRPLRDQKNNFRPFIHSQPTAQIY